MIEGEQSKKEDSVSKHMSERQRERERGRAENVSTSHYFHTH